MNYDLEITQSLKDRVRTLYAKGRPPGSVFVTLATIPLDATVRVSLFLNPTNARTLAKPEVLGDAGIDLIEDGRVPAFTGEELRIVLDTLRHQMTEARSRPYGF
jgi:hypothetical protein